MANDPRVRCATCGLTYDPSQKPLPPCGSEDGPAGPQGFSPEERKFMKCVLSCVAARRGEPIRRARDFHGRRGHEVES